jgi:hypothetical protein
MRFPVLFYAVTVIQGIVVLVGGFRYRSLPHPLRLLAWLLLFIFMWSIIEWIFASHGINNLWMSHISTVVEFVTVTLIFSSWLKFRYSHQMLFALLIGFVILWVISKFTFEPFTRLDGLTAVLSKILQITLSVLLLIKLVKESDSEVVWTQDPRLWVAIGIILYSAGSLFLFALFNKMLQISPVYLMMTWSLNWIFLIISNLLFARAFLCKK